MSFISNIRDTFVNVRKRDYEETVKMHSALEALVKRALIDAIPFDGFVEQFFPELPAHFHGHFSFLAEKIITSSGFYSIQPLPKYEDTEALYQHRDYLRGMTQVMKSSKEYEDHIFRAAHGIIFELVNALPDSVTTPTSDEIEVSFEVPASQFFHHNGYELIDIVLNHLFREELVDTPLFIVWRVIILNNFKALYENHHIRGNEYSARSLKGKLPINEFTQAIFYPLPLSNLFNFSVPFALPAEDRFKHQYVLGKTGSGKSVLLRHQIAHDLNAGHGVVVMTPERDLINDVLSYVPDSRADDVVHFDASDDTSPLVGFNPFALHDKSLLTQRAGELELILIRTLGDMGVKMKPILSNSIYALLTTQGSLHDIPKLLDPNNASYRRSIATKLDERTREFFEKYDTSTYYKEVYEPIINRLDPLLRPPLSATLTTPALDFNHLLNNTSSIVLCNLSRLRGFQAEIVGQLLLAIFQQTFFARDSLPESKRLPYFFYMDEFQTYATGSEHSLKDFLTRARKYKVGIVMAHQNTDGSDSAYYNKTLDRIYMPDKTEFRETKSRDAVEGFYATLLHEHIHWSGHLSRLSRDLSGRFGSSAYAMEELVAELGSAFLCASLGINTYPRPDHASYINSWLQVLKENKSAIFTASSMASVASQYLETLTTQSSIEDTA